MTETTPVPRRSLTPEEQDQLQKARALAASLKEQAKALTEYIAFVCQLAALLQEVWEERNVSQEQKQQGVVNLTDRQNQSDGKGN